MSCTLSILVIDRDPDYLGFEIQASNERFSGTTRLYARLDQMSEFADVISGFPKSSSDERNYEFGSREQNTAGGFCSLRFHCIDGVGHSCVEVVIEDDDKFYESASARFRIPCFPSDIDRFTMMLRQMDKNISNEAMLFLDQ